MDPFRSNLKTNLGRINDSGLICTCSFGGEQSLIDYANEEYVTIFLMGLLVDHGSSQKLDFDDGSLPTNYQSILLSFSKRKTRINKRCICFKLCSFLISLNLFSKATDLNSSIDDKPNNFKMDKLHYGLSSTLLISATAYMSILLIILKTKAILPHNIVK